MGLDKYEKTLKRLFAKFDTDEEWGYGEEGFLKRNHPSIIGFNNWVYQTIGWITKITEALTDEKKFMEHIEFPAQKGFNYKDTFEDWENMLDSYIAGDIYGIKLDMITYWWQAPRENGTWARYERLEGKYWNKSAFDYGEEEIKQMWDYQWYELTQEQNDDGKDNYYGSQKIKDYLWNDKYLLKNSKTIIQRTIALVPQSVKDEVDMRKKRMRAVIDGKEKFVCDDVWKKLDLEKIHADYEKRMGY